MQELLARRPLGRDTSEATVPAGRHDVPFGGSLMAHALLHAADRGGAGLPAHSLHAHFLRPGTAPGPVAFEAARLRRSRRFATVRVDAAQAGSLLFTGVISFHADEDSPAHAAPAPAGVDGDPDGCLAASGGVIPSADSLLRRPFDVRAAVPVTSRDRPHLGFWLKLRAGSLGPPGDAAALAWASDFVLTRVADLEHETEPRLPHRQAASLDEVIWFHRPVDLGGWLYYEVSSPSYRGARALSTGTVHDREGRLIATVMQESLLRRAAGPQDAP